MNKTLKITVRVESENYKRNSGHAPRGFGHWAFHPSFAVDSLSPDIFWTSGTYSEAKKAAKAHFSQPAVAAKFSAMCGTLYVQALP